MKRTFSIALVAAVAMTAASTYVARAELDGERLDSSVRSNMTRSVVAHRKACAQYAKNYQQQVRLIKKDYRDGELPAVSAGFAVANGAHQIFYCPTIQATHQINEQVGTRIAEALDEAASSNVSVSGVWATKTREGASRFSSGMERNLVRYNSRVVRQIILILNFLNKKADLGATYSCNHISYAGAPTPYASSFYSQDPADARIHMAITIPFSGSTSNCYISGTGQRFLSGELLSVSGGMAGGSGQYNTDFYGCAWGSATISGVGNTRVRMFEQSCQVASIPIAACPSSGAITIDR